MPDFSCYVTVRNESNSDLLLADFGLEGDGGEWPLYQPLNTIEARTSDTIHLKDRVGNYGSKGWVLFETEVGNRTEQLRLKFADPIELFSKNYIEVWSSNNNRLRGNVTRANANDHPFYGM